ncbi:MAG: alpha/beta hydrolase family protein [Promethearchaeota archaeon]
MQKHKKSIIFATILGIIIIAPLFYIGIFYYRFDHPRVLGEIPDVLLFNNQTKVTTTRQWEDRRVEITNLLLDIEYGRMPDHPDKIDVFVKENTSTPTGGLSQKLILTFTPNISNPEVTINLSVWISIPSGEGPFPTLMKVSPDGTGSQVPIADYVNDRGYNFVCYNHTELDPDHVGNDVIGPCQQAYPLYNWGSLAVWAWGAMRVLDYLVQEDWVNSPNGFPPVKSDQVIIAGHSRRGKTALLAAALDERFAMAVPSGSGCGGAASFIILSSLSETLGSITSPNQFYYWFQKDFGEYANKETTLPFDQHFLRALIAPRLLFTSDGLADYWANPAGTQAMYFATKPVYQLYNCTELQGSHFRPGGHGFLKEDFEILLDFSDRFLLAKNVTGNFYDLPFECTS